MPARPDRCHARGGEQLVQRKADRRLSSYRRSPQQRRRRLRASRLPTSTAIERAASLKGETMTIPTNKHPGTAVHGGRHRRVFSRWVAVVLPALATLILGLLAAGPASAAPMCDGPNPAKVCGPPDPDLSHDST